MVHIYFSLLFNILFLPFSFQLENMEDLITWQALDNLYVLPIGTTRDIITKDECPLKTATKCLLKSFSDSSCFSNIYNNRLLSSNNLTQNDVINNAEIFMKYLKACSIKEVQKIDLKYTALSISANHLGESVYPYCKLKITECFVGPKCISENKVFDNIINICSDATFSKLNLTFRPSQPPITTYIDDLENLAKNKIGPIMDSYTSSLSTVIIDAFGNLTYEEFDALKMITSTIPHLKQFLCDSKPDKRISRNFESIEGEIWLTDSPRLPKHVKNLFKTFTAETYKTVKAMLKIHPHLRWSFCSPIFAISPSEELTNISNVFSNPATIWTLNRCRNTAAHNLINFSAICSGLWQKN